MNHWNLNSEIGLNISVTQLYLTSFLSSTKQLALLLVCVVRSSMEGFWCAPIQRFSLSKFINWFIFLKRPILKMTNLSHIDYLGFNYFSSITWFLMMVLTDLKWWQFQVFGWRFEIDFYSCWRHCAWRD